MVFPASNRVSRVPLYSGATHGSLGFRLRGYHPLWPAFPGCSTTLTVSVATSAEVTTGARVIEEAVKAVGGRVEDRAALMAALAGQFGAEDRAVLKLAPAGTALFLVVNKTDTIEPSRLPAFLKHPLRRQRDWLTDKRL